MCHGQVSNGISVRLKLFYITCTNCELNFLVWEQSMHGYLSDSAFASHPLCIMVVMENNSFRLSVYLTFDTSKLLLKGPLTSVVVRPPSARQVSISSQANGSMEFCSGSNIPWNTLVSDFSILFISVGPKIRVRNCSHLILIDAFIVV